MTKQKSTKRAFLLSALSLLLCASMLIGSTFAWFTDSVTTAGNKIQAGTLDIQLLMNADGNGYKDISDSTAPIFGTGSIAQNNNAETLWEPGKTQVAYLAIKNNGDLALKYKVALDVENVAEDLYKVMEYAIVPDAQYGSVTSWTSGSSVEVGTQSVSGDVSLAVGATHYFALAIHMDEEAGNEYQNGEVNFDLTILATQDTVESDSFNNQYDSNAAYPQHDMKVSTAEALSDALDAGGKVVMLSDVSATSAFEYNTATSSAEKFTNITRDTIFDLNGHTLVMTNLDGSVTNSKGLYVTNGATLEITGNGTIDAVNVAVPMEASIFATNGATINIRNGRFVGGNGGFITPGSENRNDGTINIYDGTFVSAISPYWGNGVMNIYGGTFSGSLPITGNLNIYGGSFTSDPTRYLATGHKTVEVNSVYYVIKEEVTVADDLTFADFTDILSKGEDIFLTKSFTFNNDKNVNVSENVEIFAAAGAGLTFEKTIVLSGSGTVTIHSGNLVTPQEFCVSGDTKLVIESGEHSFGAFSATSNGKIVVNGGTLNCRGTYAGVLGISFAENGQLIVNDGNLNMYQPFNLNANRCDAAYIEINGGTVDLLNGIENLFVVRNVMDKDKEVGGVLRGSSIRVNGGTFIAHYEIDSAGDATSFVRNSDSPADTNKVLVSNAADSYDCVVTGGTFYGSWQRADNQRYTAGNGGYSDGLFVENSIAGFVADGYQITGDATNGYVVSAK